jgi:hypothetical protein
MMPGCNVDELGRRRLLVQLEMFGRPKSRLYLKRPTSLTNVV